MQSMKALNYSLLAVALTVLSGCATKNYVRNQTAPIIDQTNELNDKTAANNRAIHDTDDRARPASPRLRAQPTRQRKMLRVLRPPLARLKPPPTTPFIAPIRWPV